MNCSVCREAFNLGERVSYNHRETFVFKPADVKDTVNPAKVSQEELLESRKEHTRTAVAMTYVEFGKAPIPEFAFGVRHVGCLQATGASASLHPANKHAIRFSRSMTKRSHY